MTSEERFTQTKVGIFILIGIVTIGMMVVYFGRLGEGVRNYYNLRVEFPNASGLLRGSEVLLAGAKIGRMVNDPIILPDMNGVYVDLRIFDHVKIPSASEFTIGSSGLLGDKFVQIDLKPGAKDSAPIAPGTTIKGTNGGGGLGGMAEDAGALVAELRTTVGNVNSVVKKLDSGLLNEEGIASLKETLKNLQTTSSSLAAASAKVDGVVAKAETTIESGKGTMDSAKKAADELQHALSDIRALLREVRQGQGALGTLIANRETADNLRALVSNLRKYGILWYRDGEKSKSPAPER
ncbi:MAG: MCE family protein [Verrucomicrobiaceae bacterium]|nr:MAG: MCE family protein [Verrucomicrobiaceae bacterium]